MVTRRISTALRGMDLGRASAPTRSQALDLACEESIFTGSSEGAAAAGAPGRWRRGLGPDGLVVTLFPDSGERYLSKLNKQWLTEKGLIDGDGV